MKVQTIEFLAATDEQVGEIQLVPETDEERWVLQQIWRAINRRDAELPMAFYGDIHLSDGSEVSGWRMSVSWPVGTEAEPIPEVVTV